MWADLRDLIWLQWRLTLGVFRSRRGRHRLRAVAQALRIMQYVFTFPIFVALGAATAVGLAALSPAVAYAVVVAINLGLAFLWMLTPLFEESRVIERFDLLRLVQYPLSLRSLALGSTVASATSLSGLGTVPVVVGAWLGLSFHNPPAFALIGTGAGCLLATVILIGRVISDLFDVAAHDRRWRGALITALSLPLVAVWLVQAFLPALGEQAFGRILSPGRMEALSRAEGPGGFLEALGLTRMAGFLPFTWPAAAMGTAALRSWPAALLFLVLSLGTVAGLGLAHLSLTRRVMRGELLRGATSRLRSHSWHTRLPGPPDLGTLLRKDWIYLWRSPYARRFLIMTPVMSLLLAFLFLSVLQREAGAVTGATRDGLTLAFGLGWPAFVAMVLNVALTANYFGAVDREGLGTLVSSGVDRRYVLLSATLVSGALTVGLSLVPLVASVVLGLPCTVVPLGFHAAVCMQLLGTPAYLLASLIGPYRAEWRIASQASGNLWGMLAWLVGVAPVAALIALPWLLFKPALWLTMPAALVVGVAATALSLRPLGRLLLRREHDVWEAVTREE